MKKRFKAIIFDLGGVLSLGRKKEDIEGVHQYVAKQLKISIDQYFDSIDIIYANAISGKISRAKAINTMAENLKTTPKNLTKIYIKAYRKNFKKNKSLYEFALKLKKQGIKISIISDIWYVAKEALFYKEYYQDFDSVIASCDIGLRKTEKGIFKITLKKLKVSPKETIFTDNQKWNLKAPKKLGITTILFKNNKQFIEDLKKLGIDA